MIGDNTKQSRQKGVTFIEVLVVITIFGIFITSVITLFASGMKEQRKGLDKAYLLNQGSFAAEYLGRALRMAQKDTTGACIPQGFNYQITRGGNGIRFINYRAGINCQEFYLEDNKIKVERLGSVLDLTPDSLVVDNLRFNISGQDQDDMLQGKVTFTWKFQNIGITVEELELQTTISQRELDVKY
ncbi:MAG: type II secretion system protein [Parcubacteria group bacterium]|nr:type II secretion system protein [Parcubacteria group bacterium]